MPVSYSTSVWPKMDVRESRDWAPNGIFTRGSAVALAGVARLPRALRVGDVAKDLVATFCHSGVDRGHFTSFSRMVACHPAKLDSDLRHCEAKKGVVAI